MKSRNVDVKNVGNMAFNWSPLNSYHIMEYIDKCCECVQNYNYGYQDWSVTH